MSNYLIEATYTPEGAAGVADKGGTARRDAIDGMITAVGGHMQSFHFAFGESDAIVIAELPSDEAAAAVALSINRSSAATIRTVVLLTPEQMDEAANIEAEYPRPGA